MKGWRQWEFWHWSGLHNHKIYGRGETSLIDHSEEPQELQVEPAAQQTYHSFSSFSCFIVTVLNERRVLEVAGALLNHQAAFSPFFFLQDQKLTYTIQLTGHYCTFVPLFLFTDFLLIFWCTKLFFSICHMAVPLLHPTNIFKYIYWMLGFEADF